MCPVDMAGPDGHALVGCVAVSMGQVMHYWEYPQYGNDDHGYNSPYGYLYADFQNTFYDYDNMANNYATVASALLLYHAGVSVNMGYGTDGSGANSIKFLKFGNFDLCQPFLYKIERTAVANFKTMPTPLKNL